MSKCAHLDRTSMYFDGVLPEAEHAAALEHLTTCEDCQRHMRDATTFDAVLSDTPPVPLRVPARRRWPWAAGAIAVAAAAGLLVFWKTRPHDTKPPQVAIALPSERAVEARFTGEHFAPHRPFGALRGDQAHESISLATLATLEQRASSHDLLAALVATGDLPRAREVAAKLPDDAAGESDRSAVALASGDSEQALVHAYRALDHDRTLGAAWWNLALAARARALPHVARDALSHVADRGEPGWADEARTDIAALDRDLVHDQELEAFTTRARAMVDGGPPITADDVRRFPMQARSQTLDAIRLRTGDALEALRPIARELDTIASGTEMTAMLDRVKAADPALRARFVEPYRAVLAGTLKPAEIDALLAKLKAAGHTVDDLRVGAIMRAGLAVARIDELVPLVAPWHDRWFDLAVLREQLRAKYPPSDLRAESELVAAIDHCTGDVWAVRCGQLAFDLADRLVTLGREQDAERWSALGGERFRVAGSPVHVDAALAQLADIHRNLGRAGLARAEFEEIVLRHSTCDRTRFAQIGLANLALVAGDWPAVRTSLAAARAETGCAPDPDAIGVATAVDLARHTGDPADAARAREWLAESEQIADGGIALVGKLRISRGVDAAAAIAARAWLDKHATDKDPRIAGVRAWALTTLVEDAGARSDWSGVFAVAGAADRTGCVVVASYDDGAVTVAATAGHGFTGEHRTIDPGKLEETALVSPSIIASLGTCPSVSVIARPPLHGRADLLPAAMPWAFVGDTSPRSPRPLAPGRSVEVSDARPPDPKLAPIVMPPGSEHIDVRIAGADATPSRVIQALATASYAELHVHGIAAASNADATYLALSPDRDGTFALRADAVAHTSLRAAPVIVLAACHAAVVAPHLRQRWSLPDAFLDAGASAVVAADVAISNASARRVFDELHRRVSAGESVEAAVAAIRASATGDTAWAARLLVFR